MSKYHLVFAIVSLLLGGLAYLSTENIIVAAAVFGVSFLYFAIYAVRKIKAYLDKINNYNLCYNFINSFIIGISIKKTISGGYENASVSNDINFKKELESIEHLTVMERLEYLRKYFPYNVYAIFVEEIHLYEDQGGDILKITNNLIAESRREEDYLSLIFNKGKSKAVEVIILWVFSFLILAFVRFGLAQFFETIKDKPLYIAFVGVFFLFVLISFQISLLVICKVDLKESKGNE